MKAIWNLGVLWAAALSCVLAGCAVEVAEEGEGEPTLDEAADVESEGAASEEATSEAAEAIQHEPADTLACGGNKRYCLAQCSVTGDHWHVVDLMSHLTTSCSNAGAAYCTAHGLGSLTHACP